MSDSGIYVITHVETGRKYVGQSKNMSSRIYGHFAMAKNNPKRRHPFYDCIRKYGKEAFSIEKVVYVDDLFVKNLLEKEWIRFLNSIYPSGFNLASGGDHFEHHPETLKKISITSKGRRFSEEARRKISAANLGKVVSESTKRKLSEVNSGRPKSLEHRKKLSEANIGKKGTPKTAKEISALRSRMLGNKITLGRIQSEHEKQLHALKTQEWHEMKKEWILRTGYSGNPLTVTKAMVLSKEGE